jgi:hypothetical protein
MRSPTKHQSRVRRGSPAILAICILLLAALLAGGAGLAQATPPIHPAFQENEVGEIPEPPPLDESLMQNQITQTFYATQDTYVNSGSLGTNYGSAPSLLVERYSGGMLTFNKYSLIDFDLSDIPANAVIDNAVLQVYSEINRAGDSLEPEAITVVPDALLGPWEEMIVSWVTKPAQENRGDAGLVYSTGWHNISVYNIVNAWQTGALENHGISLRLSGSQLGLALFHSRDSGTTAYPRLMVTYHTEGSPALLPATEDTYINQYSPAANYGNANWVRVANGNYTLIKFDLSDLPPNIAATSAKLWLYSEINRGEEELDLGPEGTNDIYPYLITSPWSEMAVTWNSNVQAVYRSDPFRTYTTGWIDVDVTNVVSDWLSGAYVNHGIQLRLGAGGNALWDFFTRSGQKGPRLEITFENAPPPCTPLVSTNLAGPTSGLTNTTYQFTASITPPDATPPLTYTFSATGQSSSSGSANSVQYAWSTPGTKTVSVSVENCGGTVTAQRQIVISDPPPQCPFPLTGVSISGPEEGLAGTNQSFTSVLSPGSATLPVTYAWQATGQAGTLTTPTAAYTWNEPGYQTITLTASNCGGSFVAYKSFRALLPSDLADLRVSSAWYEPDQARIGFLVQNTGGRSAPAGFQVEIYRSGVLLGSGTFPVPVPAGAVRSAYINTPWSCAGSSAEIEVRADAQNIVPEGNEGNNSLFETWDCDLTPPVLTGGPNVSSITETSARIMWVTDDATSTRLSYGWSTTSPLVLEQAALSTSHTVNLTGLAPGMTYFFDIRAANANGQFLEVPRKYFQTNATGSDPPVINGVSLEKYPHPDYEIYSLKATIARPEYTERVEFYWDNQLVGTDYSYTDGFQVHFSPHQKGWTRAQFFTSHQVRVIAHNWTGSAVTSQQSITPPAADRPIQVEILSPGSDYEIYYPGASVPSGKSYKAQVSAFHSEWKCTLTGHSVGNPAGLPGIPCEGLRQKVSSLTLRLLKNGEQVSLGSAVPTGLTTSVSASVVGQTEGFYTARVTASYAGKSAEVSQDFRILRGAPPLEVERTITRSGNILTIQLTIRNISDVSVKLDKISDSMIGFQPVGYGSRSNYTLNPKSYFSSDHLVARPEFDVDHNLTPGSTFSLSYQVVPVLYETQREPKIGQIAVNIQLGDNSSRAVSAPAGLVNDPASAEPVPLAHAYINASQSADYILVTNPWQVNHHYGVNYSNDVQKTYASMAQLAALKNGVLGYLQTNERSILDQLLTPGSWWTAMLNPVFNQVDKGFVLLVGETEVIPAYHEGTSNFTTYVNIPDWVPISDLRYADTGGNTARPELVLGRIIGNNPALWLKTLNRTIDVYTGARAWDGSSAQPVSGRGDYVTSSFIPTIKIVDHVFDAANISSYPLHLYNYPHANRVDVMKAHVAEKDVIVLMGHGNPTSWNDQTFSPWNITQYPWGNTVPAVFALACRTGNYEEESDASVAEGMLNEAAAVYVGATQITELWSGEWGVKTFVRHWTRNPGLTFGQALNRLKRDAFAYDGTFDHGKLLAFSYNLYGDPKYAPSPNFKGEEQQIAVQESDLRTGSAGTGMLDLQISLPGFTVDTVEGQDYVEIPGGSWLFEDGSYLVPVVNIERDIPAGSWVQNVVLSSRGAITTTTNLVLPRLMSTPFCEGCSGDPLPPAPSGWTPGLDQHFTWRVEQKPGGGSRLMMTIYPFYYNGETSDAIYFQEWAFTIESLSTGVEITSLITDARTFGLNSQVPIELWLENQGEEQDLYIQAEIRQQVSGRLITGLPLRQMQNVLGPASLSLAWNAAGIPAGGYYIDVKVLDFNGRVLDVDSVEVDLGIASAEVTRLDFSPIVFKPGSDGQIHWQIQNSGELPLDGEAVLEIYSEEMGTPTLQITHPFSGLAPGGVIDFSDTWAVAGDSISSYTVKAFVKFESQTSSPLIKVIYDRIELYLPIIRKP